MHGLGRKRRLKGTGGGPWKCLVVGGHSSLLAMGVSLILYSYSQSLKPG